MMIGHKVLGNGAEKVIVLHGWLADHSVFEPMFPALNTERFTYAFIDYRGYGLSKQIEGEHTIAEIGNDALNLANSYGWDQFHLMGHSMGGMAIQWMMAQVPDRIKSGVAITPVPACGVPMEGEQLALFEQAADLPQNRGTIIMVTTGNRHSTAWERSMIEKSLQTTTRAAFANYFTAWSKTDFAAKIQGLSIPLKVLVGEHDLALTPEVMQQTFLQWFPNANLEVLRNSGHYPMLEIPMNLATISDTFMWEHR